MSLERFKEAQDARATGFAAALTELRGGRKTGHWIWYIFPQLRGLGRSPTAEFYALRDLDEACAYLGDATLRGRLEEVTAVVGEKLAAGVPLVELMGGTTDSLKLVSSLTLFERAARQLAGGRAAPEPRLVAFAERCGRILDAAAAQGFPRCPFTRAQA